MNRVLAKERGPFRSRIFGFTPKDDPTRSLYTPMFIPSVSSTVNADWRLTAKALSKGVAARGFVLVSAFDLAAEKRMPRALTGFRAVVLDSGGYEARRLRAKWSVRKFTSVAASFRADVVVGFDPPGDVGDFQTQIATQIRSLAKRPKGRLNTILLHVDLRQVDHEKLVQALLGCAPEFDIIGLTEKDLGPDFPERVRSLARFRRTLDGAGLVRPVHIFGADDPLSLVLYAAAGADLFDGLGWATEFYAMKTMSRHDLGHASLYREWRTFASQRANEPHDDATRMGLTLEWNLEQIEGLMAAVRRAVFKDDEATFSDLCGRSSAEARALLEELKDGR